MKENLIGFQLRVKPEDLVIWDSARRAKYLLREDINSPLSVDRDVWPDFHNQEILSKLFSNFDTCDYSAPNGLNVYDLINQEVLKQSSYYNGAVLIGITIVDHAVNTSKELKEKHSILDIPFTVEQLYKTDWQCFGYDVADQWLTSGLMNCGFDSADKAALIKEYDLNCFNKTGLFNSHEIAQKFRINRDLKIPEHSPFFIYGIWCNVIGAPCGGRRALPVG